PAQLTAGLEVRHGFAMQVLVDHLAHDLPAAANEGFAMTNLLAARVAAEEGDRHAGIAQANDRLERILAEALVHLDIDALGLRGKGAESLALRLIKGHGTSG